jgi:hypothetical protein
MTDEAVSFVARAFDGPGGIGDAEVRDRTPARMLRRNAAHLLLAEGDFTQGRAGAVRTLIDHAAALDAAGITWSVVRARLARRTFRLVAAEESEAL